MSYSSYKIIFDNNHVSHPRIPHALFCANMYLPEQNKAASKGNMSFAFFLKYYRPEKVTCKGEKWVSAIPPL